MGQEMLNLFGTPNFTPFGCYNIIYITEFVSICLRINGLCAFISLSQTIVTNKKLCCT